MIELPAEHDTPMRLFHCVGNQQAWRIILSSIAVVVMYVMISALRFVPAALSARTNTQRVIWWSIALIFPFCAISGYATNVMAGWAPELAYPLKEYMAYLDVVACLAFIAATKRNHLQALTVDEFRVEVSNMMREYPTSEVLRQLKERL